MLSRRPPFSCTRLPMVLARHFAASLAPVVIRALLQQGLVVIRALLQQVKDAAHLAIEHLIRRDTENLPSG